MDKFLTQGHAFSLRLLSINMDHKIPGYESAID